MALTKAGIIESMRVQLGFTNNKSSEITETLIEIIKRTLTPERMPSSVASVSSV